MRKALLAAACAVTALSACDRFRQEDTEVERSVDAIDVLNDVDLSDAVMQGADPHQAVAYFSRTASETPNRIDLRRGLAESLVRAGRSEEAAAAWERVVAHPQSTSADQVQYAAAMIRVGDWDKAEKTLSAIPPSYESAERYRLEAMIADSNEAWSRADAFYDKAALMTERPSGVLNNWGFSKLSRGDEAGAERMFQRALKADPSMFTAKNNLVLARGARREYTLPIVEMTQTEKAMLLHTAALAAIKQGDVATGEALLRDAIETHPQYFEAAARSLDALSRNGTTTSASSGLSAGATARPREGLAANVNAAKAVDAVETTVN
jgi:Flp pilus assembly protein TadD